MTTARKFGSVAQASDQYNTFMNRYGGAYEGATLPDEETRSRAFAQAVSSLSTEAQVHNVLTECASAYIRAEDPREQHKNKTAFQRVLRFAKNKGLLTKAAPDHILHTLIEQIDRASGRTSGHRTIDETQVVNLIKMGKALCNAASLKKGHDVEFIKGMEEVIERHKTRKAKEVTSPSIAQRPKRSGRSI